MKVLIIRADERFFATVLNCMDGRVQVPVILHLLDRFGVEYIDTIIEAGMVRYLSDDIESPQVESTLHSILISIEKHGSRQIAIVAHDDCVGNPIPRRDAAEPDPSFNEAAKGAFSPVRDTRPLGGCRLSDPGNRQ